MSARVRIKRSRLWQENNPRTFKEVTAVVPEASRKDITKSYNFIVKGLDDVVSPFHLVQVPSLNPAALPVRRASLQPYPSSQP